MATILQVIGAAAISIGAALMFIPAGVIIAGIFAVMFGLAMERNNVE
jgi:hypothetical protein